MKQSTKYGSMKKGWIKMICFGELLIKRDTLEKLRCACSKYPLHIIQKTNEILAVDLRISRIRI